MRRTIWIGLLALAAILPHLTALRATDFVFDDRGLVSKNPRVWDASPLPVLSTSYWPDDDDTGLYRPITALSYWLDGKIWGMDATGFHATNLLLHALVVLALFMTLSSLFPRMQNPVGIACLLFAVHPLHSEAVLSIPGRAELLAALFGLLGYLLARDYAVRGRAATLLVSALFFGLGALSKESAIGLGLLLGYHAIRSRKASGSAPTEAPRETRPPATKRTTGSMEPARHSSSRWWVAAGVWGAVLFVVFLLRIRVLGSVVGLGHVTRVDNPLVYSTTLERIATALGIQGWAFGKLLAPIRLSADYSYPQIVPGPVWYAIGAIVATAAVAAAIYIWRKNDEPLRWAAVFLVASGLLTANLIFPIGTVFGERLTYLPSAAALWALAVLGTRAFRGPLRIAGTVLLAIYLLALGVRTELRGVDWQDNLSLFQSASRAAPRSIKVWTNLAFSLSDEKQLQAALEAARHAEEIDPDYPGAHLALGSILNQLGRAPEAIPYLKRADDLPGKRGFDASLELGNSYLLLGQGARAESVFVSAQAMRRDDPEQRCLIGLASAQALQGRWEESRSNWREAAAHLPEDARVRHRFAFALWQAGAIDSAEVAYREALGLSPGDASIRNDLAWFLVQTQRDLEEALRLAEAAFADSPTVNIADTVLEARLAVEGCEATTRWLDSLRNRGEETGSLREKLAARCGTDSSRADGSTVE